MKDSKRRVRLLLFSLCLALFAVLLYAKVPAEGDDSLAVYYLKHAFEETGALNAVTGIYLNYRVFDTIFEALLLAVCVLAVIYLSWRNDDEV